MEAGLFVVATPIGNVGDLSARALEVLGSVDVIAAEDTRSSRKLLQQHGIETPLVSYHDHSDQRALERLGDRLRSGGSVALVSDAGTPLISDPGYRLVRLAQDVGCTVRPIPGACAAVSGLSVSGLPTDRFYFEGFLPARQGARRNRLEELARESVTLIFYEAPHRVAACLGDMSDVFGAQREAAIARELTKTFETIYRAPLCELADFVMRDPNQQKGEIVLLVAGRPRAEQEIDAQATALLVRLAKELPAKQAAAIVADHTGLRKKLLYEHLLILQGK